MNIAVYCGSTMGTDPRFAEAAHDLGRWIGSNGHGLVYGGSSIGLMGIVARTVMEAGGAVRGVETRFFMDAGVAQEGLSELYVVDSMAQRKQKMIDLADAFVALPGGVGTLEEISEIMSLVRLGQTASPCCFLNIAGFYNGFQAHVRTMLDQGFIAQADYDRFLFVDSMDAFAGVIDNACVNPQIPQATAPELGI